MEFECNVDLKYENQWNTSKYRLQKHERDADVFEVT